MRASVFNSITFIIIFQILLVLLLLKLKKKDNQSANKWLSLLVGLFGLQIFFAYSQSNFAWKIFLPYHRILYFVFLFSFTAGPIFYFYTKSILTDKLIENKRILAHFIPWLASVLISIVLIDRSEKFIIWNSEVYKNTLPILILYTGIYIFYSCRILYFRKGSKRNIGQINWIKLLIAAFVLFWFYQLFTFSMLQTIDRINWCQHTESVYFGSIFIIINSYFIYISIKPGFHELYQKRGKSLRSDALINSNAQLIIKCIEDEKMFLDPNFNLPQLSTKLGINQKYLSETINRSFNKSFIQFVNGYRIKESKELLSKSSTESYSIKEVCYQSGFNSRTAFNAAFKKETGISPSEYRKKRQ